MCTSGSVEQILISTVNKHPAINNRHILIPLRTTQNLVLCTHCLSASIVCCVPLTFLSLLQNESDEEEESEKEEQSEQILGRGARHAVLEQRTRADNSNEEKRAQRQKELAQRINEEAQIRLQGKTLGTDDKK